MAFYISLNEAIKQLCCTLETKSYERFLDSRMIPKHKYMEQVLIEYIRSSYIIIYGIRCLKREKLSDKPEVMSHEFFPVGWSQKYKWKIDYLCKDQCQCNSKPCLYSGELDLNTILSFNNNPIYSDVSIKRRDLDFLKNNLRAYFKELFPKKEVDKVKKFSIIGFINSIFSQESKKE